jgi:serine protease SohB
MPPNLGSILGLSGWLKISCTCHNLFFGDLVEQTLNQILHITMHLALLTLVAVVIVAVIVAILLLIKLLRNSGASGEKHGLLQIHKKSQFEKEEAISLRSFKERKKLKSTAPEGSSDKDKTPSANKPDVVDKPILAIKFDGDLMASARKNFAELIDEVLANKERIDSVVVVVSSPGGGVAQYGQMFSEMERMRVSSIPLTVCVDTYAASGGYLMSLPANKIVAAPYAVVGSIGVVAEMVNAYEFLKNHGFQPLTMTAGKYKRTVTPLGPVTEEGKQHMQEHLEAIHRLFITSVQKYRNVDPDIVCNGDFWTAQETVDKKLGLVDELGTSQDYLFKLNQNKDLIVLSQKKGRFEQGFLKLVLAVTDHLVMRLIPTSWRY